MPVISHFCRKMQLFWNLEICFYLQSGKNFALVDSRVEQLRAERALKRHKSFRFIRVFAFCRMTFLQNLKIWVYMV